MLRKTYVHSGPLHTVADGCTFGLYSTEEIKKLSVVEILTPLSFNALGHPLRGGLYDPRMGPFDVGGQCDTCQQSVLHCPGHFGRIDLLLPVINPLFSKTLLQICRMTCLGCREINIPGVVRHLSIAQLRLLSKGFLKEAQDAEFIIADMGFSESESKKSFTHKRAVNVEARAKFAEYVDRIFSENSSLEYIQPAPTKNIEAIKTAVIKRLLSYAKMGQKCWNCGLVCKKMMLFESKIVYTLVYPSRRRNMSAAEKGMMDMDEHNDLADPEIGEDNVVYADDEPDTHGVQKYLTPTEARDHLRGVWAVEQDFLKYLFPVLGTACTNFPTDLFFVETVSVPPPKNRAAKMVNNMMVENPQNLALRHIVTTNSMLYYVQLAKLKGPEVLSLEATKALKGIIGKSLNEKLETLWKDLQADVDHVMDREKSKMSAASSSQMIGLKQIIEKKEGLFRMHMMGKRVNYAARTVITPDPIIHIEEIGIPDVFAKVLTFPTPVTPWNVQHLRKLVMNGPNVHPGAVAVENELGQISKLDPNNDVQRAGVANRLFASDRLNLEKALPFKGVKTVYRHLMNGDYLLLNRQPSLHRPSIMAHRARVLYGDKVFRLHYANCKHYNADFDGDEMNAHFPQSHVARSEAANLVNVCSHFLVPKDGTPLSGLIQDHVVAGVRLTMRGRFFTRADYHQLVNFALSGTTKVIVTEPPTIIRPCVLWSGKQVISTVVKNLVPQGKVPLSFISGAKIKSDEWRQCPAEPWKAGGTIKGDELSESAVIIRHGELLSGVIDKVHLGATPFGLIHSFYELYGNQAAGALLSAFSRLMTNFLQWEGFTLGVKDVLVKPDADQLRRHYMEEAANVGPKAAAAGVSLKPDAPEELVAQKLEAVHRSRDNKQRAFVDLCYKQSLDQHVNQINKSCLPHGLVSIFPHNNLQLLVQSGAKGSTVNTMQMSCALGQIELEGKRPPLSISGKSLPSFKPYDVSPRAGGFIAGRFLTGIRPQEFFFHCMAGREGLIDTAVKTSRSGYLQRCLVKLLEGLVTQYDGTVRDSDGSVIQFIYGEDGLDVCKSQFLKGKQLDFLAENWKSIVDKEALKRVRHLRGSTNESTIDEMKAKFNDWVKANGLPSTKTRRGGFLAFSKSASSSNPEMPDEFDSSSGRTVNTKMLMKAWQELSPKKRKKFMKHAERCPEPIVSVLSPSSNFSVVSEKLEGLVSHESKRFKEVVFYKAMSSLSSPGDAVGVLAAQSIGEPSTQMTLNTFHFAGRGEMNVTLGIPRLREILMVASANIKTPSMDIPFLPSVKEKEAENLRLLLTSVTIAQVLQHVEVTESIDVHLGSRIYNLKFCFLEGGEYAHKFCVKPSHVLAYFERKFVKSILVPTLRKVSKQKKIVGIDIVKEGAAFGGKDDDDVDIFNLSRRQNEDDDEGDAMKKGNAFEEQEKKGMGEEHESSDEEPEADDADATQQTRRSRHTEAGYDEPEEEERLPEGETEYGQIDDTETTAQNLRVDADDELDEYEDPEDGFNKKVFKVSVFNYEARVNSVKCVDDMVMDYDFDRAKEEWCTLTIKIPLAVEKVNMSSILRTVAEKSIIHQVPNITRAFLVQTGDKMSLKTEGINILAMAAHRDLLDLNKLHCNNIHTMAENYGIEAASKVLVKEMTDVFKAYGIVIDQRHLTLIADFMTFSGTYRPFNRIGIESSASPLQQMSFETVVTFLRDATLTGKYDDLSSPSSRLVLGKPVGVGTGLFTLRQKLDLSVLNH